jgi:hypothetical protein
MRTRVAHAPRFVNTSETRRTALSVNPQFTTYKPRNSVQTTGATALFGNTQSLAQDSQERVQELHAKIGELTMERDFLSNALGRFPGPSAKR